LAARPAPTGMRRLEFVASPAPAMASSRNQSCAQDWMPQIPWFIQTFSLFLVHPSCFNKPIETHWLPNQYPLVRPIIAKYKPWFTILPKSS
jgi:hypothetical protein